MQSPRLPQIIVDKIGEVLGKPIEYPSDCHTLVLDIRTRLNETVGITTIKRLLGFVSDVQSPRKSTLDLIARYVGYESYETMTLALCPTGDSDFEFKPDIESAKLKEGDRVIFEYLPDRKVELEYIGGGEYKVVFSRGSSLRRDDIIGIASFSLDEPLKVSKVLRDGRDLGRYVAGRVSGLTSLKLVRP